jgi:hypothetical protein
MPVGLALGRPVPHEFGHLAADRRRIGEDRLGESARAARSDADERGEQNDLPIPSRTGITI